MKKIIMDCKEFLHFRQVCEKFKIMFQHTVKPGGIYIVEALENELETIGY